MATVFTISDVKRAALLTGTDYDSALPVWIAAAENQLEQFSGLSLTPRSATVYLDGRWHHVVHLPGRPVSSVTSVRIWEGQDYSSIAVPSQVDFIGQNPDYTGTPPTELVPGVDYGLRWDKNWSGTNYSLCGRLERNSRVWPGALERKQGRVGVRKIKGQGNVQVEYTYGFLRAIDIPPIFILAVASIIQAYILRIPSGGLIPTSQSLDGASVGSQVAGGSDSSGGLYYPELGDIRGALLAYVAPKVY